MVTLQRMPGWELRFSNYLEKKKNAPFIWGANDCILFAVKAVEEITGVNVYEEYLGYKTEIGAFRIVERNGGLESLISKHFGQSHKNILSAKRGDIAMLKTPEKTIGIVDDSGRFICNVSDEGFARLPLIKAWCVWSY